MGKVISFLHFSDIHFHNQSNSIYCPDKDIRNEMLLDIKRVIDKEHLQPYGIIICGDIAYSGQANEYKIAEEFINDLIQKIQVDEAHVFCVPGNHDVDQNVAKESVPVYAVQKLLEESDAESFNLFLNKLEIESKNTKDDVLYRAMKNYNQFSGKYMGNVSSSDAPWAHDIELDAGYKICLHGINSTLISNADDHKNRNQDGIRKMRVGRHQIPMRRDKVIYMTICHHPTDDWKDEEISGILDQRAMIQLYGHKHVQTLEENGRRIKIGTGALQPDRRSADWEPRYNFLSVVLEESALHIKLYPRKWNASDDRFHRDYQVCDTGLLYKEIILPLETEAPVLSDNPDSMDSPRVKETSDNMRKLVLKLWRLQKSDRERVIKEYNVFSDVEVGDLNRSMEKILAIAEENKLTEQLIKKIDSLNS